VCHLRHSLAPEAILEDGVELWECPQLVVLERSMIFRRNPAKATAGSTHKVLPACCLDEFDYGSAVVLGRSIAIANPAR